MKTKDAIERIRWRMLNSWKCNQTDMDAFNTLIDAVSNKSTEHIKNNELEAKMYILAYGYYLKFSDKTVFDLISQKEFHKLFNRPLESFIRDFQKDLNDSGQYKLLEKNNIQSTHPCIASPSQDQKDLEKLNAVLDDKMENNKLFGQVWEYDVVEKNLLTQIAQFLEDVVSRT